MLNTILKHIYKMYGENILLWRVKEEAENIGAQELKNAIELYFEMKRIWSDSQIQAKAGCFDIDCFVGEVETKLRKRFDND